MKPVEKSEAKKTLESLTRYETVDRAFGDADVIWNDDEKGETVAEGYFSRHADRDSVLFHELGVKFLGEDARELRKCGTLSPESYDPGPGEP